MSELKKYKITSHFWFFSKPEETLLEKVYEAKNEEEAKAMFWDDYPHMLGTGSIDKVEEL